MSQAERIIIIGCAGVGGPAAMMAKRLDPSLDVTLIREEESFLTRCAVPYIAVGDATLAASIKDDAMFHSVGTKLVNAKAVAIDRKARTVTTADGNVYPYDKLVLATGGMATVPKIPGVGLKGVFIVRTAQDAVNIHGWLQKGKIKNAVVLGAGAIGMEMAALISSKGVRVVLVEMLDHVFPLSFDPDMSQEIERYVTEKGINLRLKHKVTKVTGEGEVAVVELSSGESIDADMVILAGGIRPRQELAEACGLEVGKLGVRVNKYLQTSDPDIYAGGDLIEYESMVTGKPALGQIRPNAVIGGRIIAKNILGYAVEFPRLLNNFATKLFDLSVASVGITQSAAQQEGIEVQPVRKDARSRHVMIEGGKPYTLKLIFDRNTRKIIGGQIVSHSEVSVRYVDVLALAIRCELTASDLATFRCAGHPELSPEPSAEPIALAAEDIFQELYARPASK
jgi:NADH oxidase (H2O2-forming)